MENYKKHLQKEFIKNALKILLLNFNFDMIYITHKMLLLPKDYLTYLKDNIFE